MIKDPQDYYAIERRSGKDRREKKLQGFSKYLFYGRREHSRRAEDKHRFSFFDRYSSKLFAAISAILILSLVDAYFTLYLIDRGASELNPVMAYFLNSGPVTFIIAKYILTSLSVVILLIIKYVVVAQKRFNTHSLYFFIIITFVAVILWELHIIYFVVS
jgi:hypothetical protein